MSKNTRRTIRSWESAPRDGTEFHVLSIVRFNPFRDDFEVLGYDDDDQLRWFGAAFHNEPTMWLRRVPLPFEPPKGFAFTMTYECRRKTWRERLMERLFGHLWMAARWLSYSDITSAVPKGDADA